MIFKPKTMSPAEVAELENLKQQAARNGANIEYVAMMCDVELFDEESEGFEDVEEI